MRINTSKTDNKIFCRCINKNFLDKIEWKIFDFNKNVDVYELSQTFCILNSVETKYLINNLVFKIKVDHIINNNFYQSKIVSGSLFNKINNIINYNINLFFNRKNIKQIYISSDLIFFKDIIKQKYNLTDTILLTFEPCLFFGIYNMEDYKRLENYNGLKYILWGGSDIDMRLESAKNIEVKIKNYYQKSALRSKTSERIFKTSGIGGNPYPLLINNLKKELAPLGYEYKGGADGFLIKI